MNLIGFSKSDSIKFIEIYNYIFVSHYSVLLTIGVFWEFKKYFLSIYGHKLITMRDSQIGLGDATDMHYRIVKMCR